MKKKERRFYMSKNLILVTGILLLLIIAGCDGSKKDQRPITDVDIRKGTDGLIMEFLPNAPPESVFEETEFPISLKIKNAGATDVEGSIEENKKTPDLVEGGLIALGFEKAYVDVMTQDEEKRELGIKGKSIYSPLGDEGFITINAEAKKIGVQSEKHPTAIFATACYPYETILGASVCIDPEIIPQDAGKKACQIKDLIFSEGQGGPLTVTKVETRILPQDDGKVKPHFLIHIKNAGKGEIINVNEFEKACTSGELDYKKFFNIVIVSALLSGKPLKCNGEEVTQGDPTRAFVTLRRDGGFALAKSEDIIRCTLEEMDLDSDGKNDVELINSGADAYVTPLKIVLEYGYTFTISKNIIIEKVLTH